MKLHLILTFTALMLAIVFCVKQEGKAPVEPIVIVQPEVKPIKTAIIEMQLADWCGPCRRFKASGAIAELEANGWTIKYTDGLSKSYPSFRVWVDGKSETFTGYSSKNSFFKKLKTIIKRLK